MSESELERSARAKELASEQQQAALILAERRGKEAAELNARIDSHEIRLNAINGNIRRSNENNELLNKSLSELTSAFNQNLAITKSRAEDARLAAEKQVSTKTFIIGLIGAVAALSGILSAIGHL